LLEGEGRGGKGKGRGKGVTVEFQQFSIARSFKNVSAF